MVAGEGPLREKGPEWGKNLVLSGAKSLLSTRIFSNQVTTSFFKAPLFFILDKKYSLLPI